jgi:hypothetical protein
MAGDGIAEIFLRHAGSRRTAAGTAVASHPLTRTQGETLMLVLALSMLVAAAGWAAILTWVFGGGIGMFLLLFIILKMIGK